MPRVLRHRLLQHRPDASSPRLPRRRRDRPSGHDFRLGLRRQGANQAVMAAAARRWEVRMVGRGRDDAVWATALSALRQEGRQGCSQCPLTPDRPPACGHRRRCGRAELHPRVPGANAGAVLPEDVSPLAGCGPFGPATWLVSRNSRCRCDAVAEGLRAWPPAPSPSSNPARPVICPTSCWR